MKRKSLNKRKEKVHWILIIILIFIIVINGCIESKERVKENSIVKIHISGHNGTDGSIEYISQGGGKYSFENEIIGMNIGEKKNISYDEPIAVRLTHNPEKNTTYTTLNGEIMVFNVTDNEILLGHKFAGKTLNFDIKIRGIYSPLSLRKKCFSKYNISMDTIGFLHSNKCPHCTKMVSWAKDMESEDYNFLWVEEYDAEKTKIAQECFDGILQFTEGVPQFGCPSNGKSWFGTFENKEDMKTFAIECKNAMNEINIGEYTDTEASVKEGNIVEIECVGKLEDGKMFEEEIKTFKVGRMEVITGLEEAVIGMKINESKIVSISPEKSYGFSETKSRAFSQDITIKSFKLMFNEDPVLNKEYINQLVAPWPVKVVEIKTEKHNYTIEILDIIKNEG